ncbi:hypothetical protein K470DRAFT_259856 [Piedraia hortae CBS 480.64]|uniref:Sm domain-containing protein n=1 Tax=Piedraia hortae CBS 480.64 TaxID=1314780 RepID=A0A6A7BTN0_9PEZI|nr:hypothetical protein K470DRAFT_259856 [Piedraia hortae CBS 480.64]
MAHSTSVAQAEAPAPEAVNGKAFIAQYLDKKLHIETKDGRIFIGDFKCTDGELNTILSIAQEIRKDADTGEKSKRFVGLIVVPGREIVKIEVEGY